MPDPMPLRLITCGDPVASSLIEIEPVRSPTAVGVKVAEREHVPDAETLVPQLSVSAKSPLVEIDEIVRFELPILRRKI